MAGPLPHHDKRQIAYHGGTGPQNTNSSTGNQTNNTISGGSNNQQYNYFGSAAAPDPDEVVRELFTLLQCPPDPCDTKLDLKKAKGDILPDAIAWVLDDDQYRQWKESRDVGLLWVRGGAGKGKTMMSIGLIEELTKSPSGPDNGEATVVYAFCQNANDQLNTAESILKGLIWRLWKEHPVTSSALKELWDSRNRRLVEGAQTLRSLWGTFSAMVRECCRDRRLYIFVDALDECDKTGLKELLECIAHDGLSQCARVKWLLTSRPSHEAEHTMFPGRKDREQLSLDVESSQSKIAAAVTVYVKARVKWLASFHGYDDKLKKEVTKRLEQKAEGTFLWVSLACQQLEKTPKEETLSTLELLPSGLQELYKRIFHNLGEGNASMVARRMHLLKTMFLARRPLRIEELSSVGIVADEAIIKRDIELCASFVRMSKDTVEFVHQSARDFLASLRNDKTSASRSFQKYEHTDIVLSMLGSMNTLLKVNVLSLLWPPSEEEVRAGFAKQQLGNVSKLEYATTFWAHHFCAAQKKSTSFDAMQQCKQAAKEFLATKVLEWFECLSWLQSLGAGVAALRMLEQQIQAAEVRKSWLKGCCRSIDNQGIVR